MQNEDKEKRERLKVSHARSDCEKRVSGEKNQKHESGSGGHVFHGRRRG